MGGNGSAVADGYCHNCDDAVSIYVTVPWQANFCSRCGSEDVELEG